MSDSRKGDDGNLDAGECIECDESRDVRVISYGNGSLETSFVGDESRAIPAEDAPHGDADDGCPEPGPEVFADAEDDVLSLRELDEDEVADEDGDESGQVQAAGFEGVADGGE